jgi:4-amino-4-deoxy-L-arabinose transferase-like glycosyltransferase
MEQQMSHPLRALVRRWRDEPAASRFALLALLMLAVLVRVLHMGDAVRLDEKLTYTLFVSKSWVLAASDYSIPNNHVFHTLLAKGSVALLGYSLWALRLPAFVAGVLVVPATYVAVRMLYGNAAAMIATALVATSNEMIVFATNARGYSLVTLAFLILVILGCLLRAGEGTIRVWLAFVLTATLGLWTIPIMLFPLGAVVAWLIIDAIERRDPPALRRLALALLAIAALTGLCYAPVVAHSGVSSLAGNEYVTPSSWPAFLVELPRSVIETLWYWTVGMPIVLIVLLGFSSAIALLRHRVVSTSPVGLPHAAIAWCGLFLLASRRMPPERVWQWFLPIVAGLAGAALIRGLRALPRGAVIAESRIPLLALALGIVNETSLLLRAMP